MSDLGVALAAVGTLMVINCVADGINHSDLERDATTYAGKATEVNAMFAVAGKGLLVATIAGKECFIRADKGLPGTHKVLMTCAQ
jgi:hypothetical protein